MRNDGLTIIVPCKNEEKNLGSFLEELFKEISLDKDLIKVIVVNNNSTDRSFEIATEFKNIIVLNESISGYGAAIKKGIESATTKWVAIIDADNTYLPSDLLRLYKIIKTSKADKIYGTRIKGKIENGAMPFLHQYIGTPFLTGVFNLLYSERITDINSGLRIFKLDCYQKTCVKKQGMSFASELFIEFSLKNFKIIDSPINYRKSTFKRKPHMNTFRDGFDHLNLILSKFFSHKVKSISK